MLHTIAGMLVLRWREDHDNDRCKRLVHLRARHSTLARISPLVRGRSSKMRG